jgi:hypothetical protein
MARLLTLFMILCLVVTQGSSMAAAVCRHQSVREHVLARQSGNRQVAAVSLREEAAAAVASKKASPSADALGHVQAELLPSAIEAAPPSRSKTVPPRPARQAALASTTIIPLLKPPSA